MQLIQQHVKDCENAAGEAKHSYVEMSSRKKQIHKRIGELKAQEVEKNGVIAELEKKITKAKNVMREDSNEPWGDIVARREQNLKQAEL